MEHFGRYRLDGLIGQGGMGEVYRAFDTVKDRTVALKRLPVALAADADFQARFRKESALAARLSDPHIIPIHDYGEIDGRLFIDMRLVAGQDLAALLSEGGPMAPDRAVSLVSQVAQALTAAHADGLIHRDVKPSNVLISGSGDGEFAYLIDFGISRALAGSGSTSFTATGATVGTLDYMAPERFLDGPVDERIDVYALACVLCEALTGRKPFRGDGLPAMIHAHLNLAPPVPSRIVEGVPTALDDVVATGMAKDPTQRYASAEALATAARSALLTERSSAVRTPRVVVSVPVPVEAPASTHLNGMDLLGGDPADARVLSAGPGTARSVLPTHVPRSGPAGGTAPVSPTPSGDSSPARRAGGGARSSRRVAIIAAAVTVVGIATATIAVSVAGSTRDTGVVAAVSTPTRSVVAPSSSPTTSAAATSTGPTIADASLSVSDMFPDRTNGPCMPVTALVSGEVAGQECRPSYYQAVMSYYEYTGTVESYAEALGARYTTLTYSGSSACTRFYDATFDGSGRAVVEIYEDSPFAQVRTDSSGRLSYAELTAMYGYDEYTRCR